MNFAMQGHVVCTNDNVPIPATVRLALPADYQANPNRTKLLAIKAFIAAYLQLGHELPTIDKMQDSKPFDGIWSRAVRAGYFVQPTEIVTLSLFW